MGGVGGHDASFPDCYLVPAEARRCGVGKYKYRCSPTPADDSPSRLSMGSPPNTKEEFGIINSTFLADLGEMSEGQRGRTRVGRRGGNTVRAIEPPDVLSHFVDSQSLP